MTPFCPWECPTQYATITMRIQATIDIGTLYAMKSSVLFCICMGGDIVPVDVDPDRVMPVDIVEKVRDYLA